MSAKQENRRRFLPSKERLLQVGGPIAGLIIAALYGESKPVIAQEDSAPKNIILHNTDTPDYGTQANVDGNYTGIVLETNQQLATEILAPQTSRIVIEALNVGLKDQVNEAIQGNGEHTLSLTIQDGAVIIGGRGLDLQHEKPNEHQLESFLEQIALTVQDGSITLRFDGVIYHDDSESYTATVSAITNRTAENNSSRFFYTNENGNLTVIASQVREGYEPHFYIMTGSDLEIQDNAWLNGNPNLNGNQNAVVVTAHRGTSNTTEMLAEVFTSPESRLPVAASVFTNGAQTRNVRTTPVTGIDTNVYKVLQAREVVTLASPALITLQELKTILEATLEAKDASTISLDGLSITLDGKAFSITIGENTWFIASFYDETTGEYTYTFVAGTESSVQSTPVPPMVFETAQNIAPTEAANVVNTNTVVETPNANVRPEAPGEQQTVQTVNGVNIEMPWNVATVASEGRFLINMRLVSGLKSDTREYNLPNGEKLIVYIYAEAAYLDSQGRSQMGLIPMLFSIGNNSYVFGMDDGSGVSYDNYIADAPTQLAVASRNMCLQDLNDSNVTAEMIYNNPENFIDNDFCKGRLVETGFDLGTETNAENEVLRYLNIEDISNNTVPNFEQVMSSGFIQTGNNPDFPIAIKRSANDIPLFLTNGIATLQRP